MDSIEITINGTVSGYYKPVMIVIPGEMPKPEELTKSRGD